jgi:hypothetical protein
MDRLPRRHGVKAPSKTSRLSWRKRISVPSLSELIRLTIAGHGAGYLTIAPTA